MHGLDTAAISPDGSKIAFRDAKEHDLWVASTNGGQLTRLTNGHVGPRQIAWSKQRSTLSSLASDLIYYLDGSGAIHLIRASGGDGAVAALPHQDARPHRGAVPGDVRSELALSAEHFYDASFHGRDWNAIRDKYRPLLSSTCSP